MRVNAGKWYYEVQLQSGQMQVGWCLDNYDVCPSLPFILLLYVTLNNNNHNNKQPSTNTGDSWAYDTSNAQIYRKGGNQQSFGEYCYANEWIGVGLDLKAKTITFYRNGKSLGEAWKDVDLPGKNDRITPFIALARGAKAKFNFGKDGFSYSQERAGYHPLHSKLNDAEIKELGKLFNKYKGNYYYLLLSLSLSLSLSYDYT